MTRTKAEWRKALLAARRAIEAGVRRDLNAAMMDRVARLPCFIAARTLVGYVAIGAEADPIRLLECADATHVLVPASDVSEGEPRWNVWRRPDREGHHGIESSSPAVVYPALVLVPGVGFDHGRMRLGRGRGFYDRALRALRRAGEVHIVGLAFECQIVPELPCDSWDQRVDFIVSEARVIAPTTPMDARVGARSW